MAKLSRNILIVVCVLVIFATVVFAQESVTVTTYYPSPYGSYKDLNVFNQNDSSTQTDFTQGLTYAGLVITTDYSDGSYTPGVFWSTQNNNATKPKAGIYLKETNTGTQMYLGTSNSYATGITNNGIVINEVGNVGIGTTTPGTTAGSHRLSVVGTAGLSSGTAWTSTSDQRWKDVSAELKGSTLSKILALRPVSYTWNETHDKKFGKNLGLKYGFIAQEVQNIFPTMISQDVEGYFWYNPSGMEAVLTAAIQEQQDIIKAQQVEINELKVRLEKLEKRVLLAGK